MDLDQINELLEARRNLKPKRDKRVFDVTLGVYGIPYEDSTWILSDEVVETLKNYDPAKTRYMLITATIDDIVDIASGVINGGTAVPAAHIVGEVLDIRVTEIQGAGHPIYQVDATIKVRKKTNLFKALKDPDTSKPFNMSALSHKRETPVLRGTGHSYDDDNACDEDVVCGTRSITVHKVLFWYTSPF